MGSCSGSTGPLKNIYWAVAVETTSGQKQWKLLGRGSGENRAVEVGSAGALDNIVGCYWAVALGAASLTLDSS